MNLIKRIERASATSALNLEISFKESHKEN